MIIQILITIFTTALAAVGLYHMVETGIAFWTEKRIVPFNLIMFIVAVICFYIIALYAIWGYLS